MFLGKKTPSRTCLECGFLTIDGRELSTPARTLIGSMRPRSSPSGLPLNVEQTCCYKSLWDSDIQNMTLEVETLIRELNADRGKCPGFFAYEPLLDPAAHLV